MFRFLKACREKIYKFVCVFIFGLCRKSVGMWGSWSKLEKNMYVYTQIGRYRFVMMSALPSQ